MAKKKKPSKDQPKRKSKGSKGGFWAILFIALLTFVAGIALLSYFGDRLPKPVREKIIEEKPKPAERNEISLFFSDEEGLYLKAEKRTIKDGPLEAEVKEAVAGLIEGPRDSKLGATLPEGARLIGVKVKGSTATVDFSRELSTNHPGGASGEIQTVYSIVNTIALNFPEVKDVQILIDGKREETLAGHIDITVPLGPDKKIIKN